MFQLIARALRLAKMKKTKMARGKAGRKGQGRSRMAMYKEGETAPEVGGYFYSNKLKNWERIRF